MHTCASKLQTMEMLLGSGGKGFEASVCGGPVEHCLGRAERMSAHLVGFPLFATHKSVEWNASPCCFCSGLIQLMGNRGNLEFTKWVFRLNLTHLLLLHDSNRITLSEKTLRLNIKGEGRLASTPSVVDAGYVRMDLRGESWEYAPQGLGKGCEPWSRCHKA